MAHNGQTETVIFVDTDDQGSRNALLLCRDERLNRLLRYEMSLFGLSCIPVRDGDISEGGGETFTEAELSELPKILPPDAVSGIVADGDDDRFRESKSGSETACPLSVTAERIAALYGCPLLLFSRSETPEEAGNALPGVTVLHRPFSLKALEGVFRSFVVRDGGTDTGMPIRLIPDRPASRPKRPHLSDGKVVFGSVSVSLTPAEQEIYACLESHIGRIVPRHVLAARIGGGGNSVDVYVCRLRGKIEKPLGMRLITTVRGQGYRMERL